LALFGGVTLDLRGALLEGDEVNVQATAIFGGVDVIVPEGVEVDLTGLAIFGGKETQGKAGMIRPGAPLVHVNAFVLFGATNVKVKPPEESSE
jgi:predicted membrane protein